MSKIATNAAVHGGTDVRDRILETASELFYRQGVRAVGVDLVVEKAGVAKDGRTTGAVRRSTWQPSSLKRTIPRARSPRHISARCGGG